MGSLLRLIDANLNRLREGLRVAEDIARFILNDKSVTRSLKTIRHAITRMARDIGRVNPGLLKSRNVKRDIGKKSSLTEKKRKDICDIFLANTQRSKESLRVLEEVTKLIDKKLSEKFKKTRFRLYEIEKTTRIKLEALLHNRRQND